MASIIILNIVTGDIVTVVLVDGVVTQMHAGIPQIAASVVVLDCCKPDKYFVPKPKYF